MAQIEQPVELRINWIATYPLGSTTAEIDMLAETPAVPSTPVARFRTADESGVGRAV